MELHPNPVIETKNDGDITITYTAFNGGDELQIFIEMQEIGNGHDDPTFDAEFIVGNGDWANPREMQQALALALDHFYATGLNKRFGRMVGERA